jgi:hypothetical protein
MVSIQILAFVFEKCRKLLAKIIQPKELHTTPGNSDNDSVIKKS